MNSNVQLALWIAHPVLQIAVAVAMFRHKLHRVFTVFFTYIIFQIASFFVLFPIFQLGDYEAYFYTYWSYAAISLVLGFMIIREIFLDVFRPFHTLKDLGLVMFKWAALVMLLVAFVVAAGSAASELGSLGQAVMTVQRCVRVIQCGLILFLLVFSRYLGVSRKQHSFGVALGFGCAAVVELTMETLRASGRATQTGMNVATMVSYNCAIAIWFVYALAKDRVREHTANLLVSQRWEQSLTDLQHPAGGDSLIPMFEGMVDQAFSRTGAEPAHEETGTATLAS